MYEIMYEIRHEKQTRGDDSGYGFVIPVDFDHA